MFYQTKKDDEGRYIGGVLDGPLSYPGKYRTVVIDPPWTLTKLGWAKTLRNGLRPDIPYNKMTFDDIAALPLPEVLADDARVFVWTVSQILPHTFGLLDAWGLKYQRTHVWNKNGGIQVPQSPQMNAEFILEATIGKPKFVDTKQFFTCNRDAFADGWKRAGHSVKPEAWYQMIARTCPGPRLDVFARRHIVGFDGAGDLAPINQG